MLNHITRLDAKDLISVDTQLIAAYKKVKEYYPLHWHDFFEFDIILKGKGYQLLNGKKYPLRRGTAYLLRPTDFHSLYAEEPLELYNIMFNENILSDEFIEMLLNMHDDIIAYLPENTANKIEFNARLMEEECAGIHRFRDKFIKNLLESVLILFIRETQTQYKNDPYAVTPIKKAIFYMHLHFRENPALKTTAEIAGFCPNYFCEIFHRHTGYTYTEYLTRLKLNYARQLLESCDITSTDVCFECGFSSLSNFLKAFKKHFGISPGKYSEQHRSEV